MNLDLLIKILNKNYHRLPNKTIALNLLRYNIELLQWKRNKLKLGAIIFEIKETYFHGVLLLEEIDIRHIRQDNTDTDELKIENRLKAIGWKWDLKNVLALLFVIFGLCCELYTYVHYWYCKNLPTLAYRAEHFDYILKFGFETSFYTSNANFLQNLSIINHWLIETLTDFCIYFNIIF